MRSSRATSIGVSYDKTYPFAFRTCANYTCDDLRPFVASCYAEYQTRTGKSGKWLKDRSGPPLTSGVPRRPALAHNSRRVQRGGQEVVFSTPYRVRVMSPAPFRCATWYTYVSSLQFNCLSRKQIRAIMKVFLAALAIPRVAAGHLKWLIFVNDGVHVIE